jgi:hypothetical protein
VGAEADAAEPGLLVELLPHAAISDAAPTTASKHVSRRLGCLILITFSSVLALDK